MKKFRWPVAVLAFLLTLALSVGLVHLRQRQLVNEPLQRRLGELEAVESVQLTRQGNLLTVSVHLGYVADLASLHALLSEEIENTLGHRSFRLELLDRRDFLLENAFMAIHLPLFEAVQRGNFTEMSLLVADRLREVGIAEHKVVVSAEHLYFQARQGDSYIYAIIDRAGQRQEERALD